MPGGCDEIQAGMQACVMIFVKDTADFQLLLQKDFKLCVDVLHDRSVAGQSRVMNLSLLENTNTV